MRNRQITLTLIIITALLTPMAAAVTIDGPTNFQGPHGGIVHYTTASATQTGIIQGIWRFTNLRVVGPNLVAVGFDCSANVTMTIVSASATQIVYTVVGTGTQYVYFKGQAPAAQLGAATMDYNVTTGIAALTSLTGATVTVFYGVVGNSVSSEMILAQSIVILLLPLLVLAVAVNDFRNDMLGSGTVWKIVMMVAVFGFMAWIFASWGY